MAIRSRARLYLAFLLGLAFVALSAEHPAWAEPQSAALTVAQPVRPNYGAISQPTPALPQTMSDRNAAYFNRPGAIPRTSFQPVNNNAPIVQQPSASPPVAAAPFPEAGSSASASASIPPAQPSAPAASALAKPVAAPTAAPVSRGPHILIRPAPVAPRILKERTRIVPSAIIQPKPLQPTRIFPAHGPQPPRGAPGAIPQNAAAPVQPTAAGIQQLQAAQPTGIRPGTIIAPPAIARPGSIQRQATAPRPYSQTTGSLPTLAPRPRSIFEGPKAKPPLDPTTAKGGAACAGNLTAC